MREEMNDDCVMQDDIVRIRIVDDCGSASIKWVWFMRWKINFYFQFIKMRKKKM